MDTPIAIFYHIAGMGRWKSIVIEHLNLLFDSELYDNADKIFFSFVGSKSDYELLKIITANHDKISTVHISENVSVYEYPTLLLLQNYVQYHNGDILYFHTKGTTYTPENPDFEASNRWRQYMNFFVIKNWKFSMLMLEHFDTVGVSSLNTRYCNWHDLKIEEEFYAGNYWWAKSEYLKTLPKIQSLNQSNRWNAEVWVAMGNSPKAFSWENKYWSISDFKNMNTTESDWQQTINNTFLNV